MATSGTRPSAGRRDAGQHPVDLAGVGEGEDHFVDDLIGADGAAHRRHAGVGRIAADEMVLVEALQLVVSDAAGQGRHVVDVRRPHHARQSLDVAGLELVAAMRLPEGDEVVGHGGGMAGYLRAGRDCASTAASIQRGTL
jgi:hypothetical protein